MKRMKHVFKSSEVFHIFANQPDGQEYGSAGNMSFKGNIAYSYGHYAIGNIVDSVKKRVLIQEDRYSSSTGGHINQLCYALNHYDLLTVPDVIPCYPRDHICNIEYFHKRFNEYCDKNNHSLKYEYYSEAIGYLQDAIKYCQWFKCKSKLSAKLKRFINIDISKIELLQSTKRIEIEQRKARLQSPEHQAKLRAKYAVEIKELTIDINTFNTDYPDRIKRWKNHGCSGIQNYFPWYNYKRYNLIRQYIDVTPVTSGLHPGKGSYLRLSTDRTRIETSQGAQVLCSHIPALWRVINNSYKHKTYVTNCNFKIDYYTVRKIDNGNLTIGCHYIEYAEMLEIAELLNLEVK